MFCIPIFRLINYLLTYYFQCIQTLCELVSTSDTGSKDSVNCEAKKKEQMELNKDLIKIMCYKAEKVVVTQYCVYTFVKYIFIKLYCFVKHGVFPIIK